MSDATSSLFSAGATAAWPKAGGPAAFPSCDPRTNVWAYSDYCFPPFALARHPTPLVHKSHSIVAECKARFTAFHHSRASSFSSYDPSLGVSDDPSIPFGWRGGPIQKAAAFWIVARLISPHGSSTLAQSKSRAFIKPVTSDTCRPTLCSRLPQQNQVRPSS